MESGASDLYLESEKKGHMPTPEAKELYEKAGEAFESGDFENAIKLYTSAIEKDPKYASAYFNRALAYAIKDMYEEAEKDVEKVMEIEPDSFDAPFVMGMICEYKGDYEGAVSWYEKSLEKNPNYELAKSKLVEAEKKARGDEHSKKYENIIDKISGLAYQSSAGAMANKEETVIEEGQIRKVKWYKSKIKLEDIVGMEKVKEEMYATIILAIKKPELLRAYGKKLGTGVLFYGPPGCGKTFLVNAIAGETNSNVIIARINEIVDMYAGNTEKNIHSIFEQARKNAPCIIFFDELDALGAKRESVGEQQSYMRMAVNQFLQEMDGVEENPEGIFVIGATNQPWDIDPALKRSRRFGDSIYIGPPSYKERKWEFMYYTRKRPIGRISFGRLARATMGFSRADIEEICDKASLLPAIEEDRTGRRRKISMRDFLKVIKAHGNTLDEWYAMVRKEIISRRKVQIVDGKKTEIEEEGKLSAEEKQRYKEMIKDVKKNSSPLHRFMVKMVRWWALHVF
ncbi:MAG: AAA family ATPase [Candidatus Micrarchaeaceae archaeon]